MKTLAWLKIGMCQSACHEIPPRNDRIPCFVTSYQGTLFLCAHWGAFSVHLSVVQVLQQNKRREKEKRKKKPLAYSQTRRFTVAVIGRKAKVLQRERER
jgi:hypothetical protein